MFYGEIEMLKAIIALKKLKSKIWTHKVSKNETEDSYMLVRE